MYDIAVNILPLVFFIDNFTLILFIITVVYFEYMFYNDCLYAFYIFILIKLWKLSKLYLNI